MDQNKFAAYVGDEAAIERGPRSYLGEEDPDVWDSLYNPTPESRGWWQEYIRTPLAAPVEAELIWMKSWDQPWPVGTLFRFDPWGDLTNLLILRITHESVLKIRKGAWGRDGAWDYDEGFDLKTRVRHAGEILWGDVYQGSLVRLRRIRAEEIPQWAREQLRIGGRG